MTPPRPVVVFAGGTGGAKLARGMLDVVASPEELVVVANTGDDIEIYGAHVSPDPDLVTFWLADRIDERGWGLDGDTFHAMAMLRELGREVWFNLGDRDLAIGLERARRLAVGERLTEAHAAIAAALGVRARVLPMCDEPVRTRIASGGRTWSLQEFLIVARGEGEISDVDLRGARAARITPEVAEALRTARAIIVGPSNPVISIGPILAVPGMQAAIAASPAPVVAVSPIVAGAVLKGPTAAFLRHAGHPLGAAGIAAAYDGVIDGLVADEREGVELPLLATDLLMDGPAGRARLARETLAFADGLAAAE